MRAKTKLGKGTKLILVLALIVATATGLGLYTYLDRQNVTVYLFANDYTHGERVTGDMFATYEMPLDLYNAMKTTGNAYATADQIRTYIENGDVLLVDVAQYTPVTLKQFVTFGGTPIEARLAPDMVSVELPAEIVSGLSGEIAVGSRLNIATGYAVDSAKYTDLIFQNLLVVETVLNDDGSLNTVYVEVDPAESLQLIHAVTFEKVTASIIKPDHYIPIEEQTSYQRYYTSDPDVVGIPETMPQEETGPVVEGSNG